MIGKPCFQKGCTFDAEYICKCTSLEIYCCKRHFNKHLKLSDRTHSFESIFVEPCEGTQKALLEFLAKVECSYQEQKEKLLASYGHIFDDLENFLKELMREVFICSVELNHFSSTIAKTKKILKSEQDPVLRLLSLHPEEAIEIVSTVIPINPNWYNRANAIYREAERSHLESEINEENKGLKIFEEGKEEAKGKTESKINKPQRKTNENSENTQTPKNSILQILRDNESQIFSKQNNAELEYEFRMTCLIYESSDHYHSLAQSYQKYVNTYHQKSSVYNIIYENELTTLCIYDTESESKEKKILEIQKNFLDYATCITQLPNGKLFCYDHSYFASGISFLIDENYEVEVLPSGASCCLSSAIYFNQNIYFFGGHNSFTKVAWSLRFDLVQNVWRELTPMPQSDWRCNCVIFNGNILIARYKNRKLLLYSIDIDSYSTIPYDFAKKNNKILINAESLYLIECKNGSIYESEIENYTSWRRIADSIISYDPYQVYCTYNKEGVYIGFICSDSNDRPEILRYFKFSLGAKSLTELS